MAQLCFQKGPKCKKNRPEVEERFQYAFPVKAIRMRVFSLWDHRNCLQELGNRSATLVSPMARNVG